MPTASGTEYSTGTDSRDSATRFELLDFDSPQTPLVWWLRIVGVFYLLLFVMAVFVKLPVREFAPEGTLALAASGDPMAMYLVDTWVMFGLEMGVIGLALVVGSWYVEQAKFLAWTVLGLELVRGIVDDIYMLLRGYEPEGFIVWIIVHSVIILAGYLAIRTARRGGSE